MPNSLKFIILYLSRPSLEKFNFGDILNVKKEALNVAKNVKCLNFIAHLI